MILELREALEDEGYIVHSAKSAADALDLLAAHPEIGLMISDIRMPGMDGLELTRLVLHQQVDAEAVEVILMTGHATVKDAAAVLRSGAFDLVRKPFRLNEMIMATSRGMARSIGRREVAAARAAVQDALDLLANIEGREQVFSLTDVFLELRGPLITILGGADLISQPPNEPEIREFGKDVSAGGRQILGTLTDATALALKARGMLNLSLDLISAETILGEILDHAKNKLEEKEISHDIKIGSPKFIADGARLQRSINNLIRIMLHITPRLSTILLTADLLNNQIVFDLNGCWNAHQEPLDTLYHLDDPWSIASNIAPLGLKFTQAILELHNGSLELFQDERSFFRAVARIPYQSAA